MRVDDCIGRACKMLVLLVVLLFSVSCSARQRTVYCMGETVLDILFRGATPLSANAGGSALNSAVSLSRAGAKVSFIGEVGNDSTGSHILDFLQANIRGSFTMIQCSKERARRSRPFGLRFASPSRTLDDVGSFVVCPLRGHDRQSIMRFSQVSSA